MSLALVHTRAQVGVEAPPVVVEAHLANGLPALTLVGLPETAVREAKDRVRSAILNAGFEFPSRRITLNLAPADLPKEGSHYDLPVALALLAAMFVLALTVMDADYLGTQLGRPTVLLDYVHLAWLSSCLGAFAGALGSNFDDENVVRTSVGVGLIWASPFGPLRFDYAFPILKQDFDRTQQFRFGGGTRF